MKKQLILLMLLLPFILEMAYSQRPPCQPEYLGLTFQADDLPDYPPYSIYMPYDVLIGYIALDSLRKYGDESQFEQFIARQSYNDTLRTIMRYMYQVCDYDPIKFALYTDRIKPQPPGYRGISVNRILTNINKQIREASPSGFVDQTLEYSDYILHIRVVDTLYIYDSSAGWTKNVHIVTCEILDTIKGKVIPVCKQLYTPPAKILDYELPSPCFQFDYSLDWHLGGNFSMGTSETTLGNVNGTGRRWIQKDREYIIFLKIEMICNTLDSLYYDISPIRWNNSKVVSMYPIENGRVVDDYNEFGCGTSPTVAEFKACLRARIQEIITYQP